VATDPKIAAGCAKRNSPSVPDHHARRSIHHYQATVFMSGLHR
jgi:hypothetical protein